MYSYVHISYVHISLCTRISSPLICSHDARTTLIKVQSVDKLLYLRPFSWRSVCKSCVQDLYGKLSVFWILMKLEHRLNTERTKVRRFLDEVNAERVPSVIYYFMLLLIICINSWLHRGAVGSFASSQLPGPWFNPALYMWSFRGFSSVCVGSCQVLRFSAEKKNMLFGELAFKLSLDVSESVNV